MGARLTRVAFTVIVLSSAASALAQSRYVAPRTPWGDPDLQGKWPANDMSGTGSR